MAPVGNREALLEGALKCIQEKGYGRTTARDLAGAAGTNLGAIGYHFGSTEQLLNEAIGLGFQRWLARFAEVAAAAHDDDPRAALRQMAREIPASLERNRHLAVAFVEALAQAERAPAVRKQLAKGYETSRAAVAALIEAQVGDGPDLDTRALASLMIAVFDGLLVQWILDPKRAPSGIDVVEALEAGQRAVGAAAGVEEA